MTTILRYSVLCNMHFMTWLFCDIAKYNSRILGNQCRHVERSEAKSRHLGITPTTVAL